MSGHSKWHNIQRRKGKQDSVRGQLFTRLSKDVYQAAKEGGGNPETNFRLKVAVDRAKSSNLSADSIARTITKATGTLAGITYEELQYEGFGPYGIAILIDIVTDNRNRTAADIRHLFKKRGGNLGESGVVAWMFQRQGQISVAKSAIEDGEALMLLAIEAGASDVEESPSHYVLITEPESFHAVRTELESQGIAYEEAELTYEPSTTVALSDEALDEVLDLLDALEALDDVQTVYSNVLLENDQEEA